MSKESYFELRCATIEMFYEVLLDEKYTIGQAAARCLVEFRNELQSGGREALVVLSVLMSTVARRDPKALSTFTEEVATLRTLSKKPSCWRGFSEDEKERMKEDVAFTLETV